MIKDILIGIGLILVVIIAVHLLVTVGLAYLFFVGSITDPFWTLVFQGSALILGIVSLVLVIGFSVSDY